MTKEYIIKNSIELIKMFSKELNLNVNNKGVGHAFDNSFWEGIFTDRSDIPEITATNENGTFKIELRSFWGHPEISIRDKIGYGEDLYVIQFCDSSYDENGNYIRTGDFKLYEIRIDVRNNHRSKLDMLFDIVNYIETSKGYGVENIRKLVNEK